PGFQSNLRSAGRDRDPTWHDVLLPGCRVGRWRALLARRAGRRSTPATLLLLRPPEQQLHERAVLGPGDDVDVVAGGEGGGVLRGDEVVAADDEGDGGAFGELELADGGAGDGEAFVHVEAGDLAGERLARLDGEDGRRRRRLVRAQAQLPGDPGD